MCRYKEKTQTPNYKLKEYLCISFTDNLYRTLIVYLYYNYKLYGTEKHLQQEFIRQKYFS